MTNTELKTTARYRSPADVEKFCNTSYEKIGLNNIETSNTLNLNPRGFRGRLSTVTQLVGTIHEGDRRTSSAK